MRCARPECWRRPRCTPSTTTSSGSPPITPTPVACRRAGGDRRRADRTGPGRDQHRHLRGRGRARDLRPDVGARDQLAPLDPQRVTVTHLDVDDAGIERALEEFRQVLEGPAAEAPATQAARPPAARDRQTRSPALAPGWCSRAPRRAPRRPPTAPRSRARPATARCRSRLAPGAHDRHRDDREQRRRLRVQM